MQKDIQNTLEKWKDRNLIEYECISYEFKDWDNDEYFMRKFPDRLENIKPDIVISVNFMPLVSEICERYGIEYISWVYDAPMHIRKVETLKNSCNKVYMFDRGECNKLNLEGYKNVYHMPLAVDFNRVQNDIANSQEDYSCDVSFVGRMYNSDYVYIRQALQSINSIMLTKLDGIVQKQIGTLNYIIRDSLNDEIVEIVAEDLLKASFNNGRKVILQELEYALATYTTSIKRKSILMGVSKLKNCNFDIYTSEDISFLKDARNKGVAAYYRQMYKIFSQSKINLNITLDIIKTGMPLRVIDIFGAGGFLLTNYQEEFLEYFEERKHLIIYRSIEEAIDLVRYYLVNEAERKQIAYNGYLRAKECLEMEKVLYRLIFGE